MVLLSWVEVFKEIAKTVPVCRIQTECLLLAECLSDPSERLLSRKIGAMIICHISSVIPPLDYSKSYVSFLKKLSEDSNWEVRQLIAEKIPSLCKALGPELSQQSLFDIALKLSEDPQHEVLTVGVESLGLSLKHFTNAQYFDKAVVRLKAALNVPDPDILQLVIKNIGAILDGISREKLEKDPELSIMFQTILLVAVDNNLEQSAEHLAQNLPAIVLVYGPDYFSLELFGLIEKLLLAPDLAKATFAKGFHEVVTLFGFKLGIEKLKGCFFELLSDPSVLVVDAILENIETIIETFCPDPRHELCAAFMTEYFDILSKVHQKVKAKSWRTEGKFLAKLGNVLGYLNAERVCGVILPIFKAVFTSSPRECKLEACDLLSQILTGFCQNPIRAEIHTLVKSLARSMTYQDRISYLEFVCALLNRMSKHYFKEHFLASTLSLGEDHVVGVQFKFCDIALDIKKNILPEDVKNFDRLFSTLNNMIKTTRCKSLKERAEKALEQLKAAETQRGKDEDEEARFEREKDILRKEKRELEESKKLISETKHQLMKTEIINGASKSKSVMMVQGAKIKKQGSMQIVSPVTIANPTKPKAPPTKTGVIKPMAAITQKQENVVQPKVKVLGTEKQIHQKVVPAKKKRQLFMMWLRTYIYVAIWIQQFPFYIRQLINQNGSK
eukprot:TRINITY_DN105680_c2_g1_i1.p2 TRINITY_DN105680_c2_g1~~TRINITY_DN105680_c2_g1_i1.p2  ORF type:complete len:671 (+),score=75.51 TRINITY_DN105680_c2_g1_i1:4778-6790(+)